MLKSLLTRVFVCSCPLLCFGTLERCIMRPLVAITDIYYCRTIHYVAVCCDCRYPENKYYTEGDGAHWRFAVPHDIPGLISLFPTADAFVSALQVRATFPVLRVSKCGRVCCEAALLAYTNSHRATTAVFVSRYGVTPRKSKGLVVGDLSVRQSVCLNPAHVFYNAMPVIRSYGLPCLYACAAGAVCESNAVVWRKRARHDTPKHLSMERE